MHTLELIEKTQEYLDYLKRHVEDVGSAWSAVQAKCADMRFVYDDFFYATIQNEVIHHDASKLSEFEFVQYRRAFYPASFEPQDADLGEAWEHHKANNAHHWETWTARDTTQSADIAPWSWEISCVHMVLDWMAMSYEMGGSARQYYRDNEDRIQLPEHAKSFVLDILGRVEGPEGE